MKLEHVLFVVATTVLDCGGSNVPQGHIYMGLNANGVSLDQFQTVLNVLVQCGLAETTSETISLTEKGRKNAEEWNDLANKEMERIALSN